MFSLSGGLALSEEVKIGYFYLNDSAKGGSIFVGDIKLSKKLKEIKLEKIYLDRAVMRDVVIFFNKELFDRHNFKFEADKETLDRLVTTHNQLTLHDLLLDIMKSTYTYAEVSSDGVFLKSYGNDQEQRTLE